MLAALFPFIAFLNASLLAVTLALAGARAVEDANLAAAADLLGQNGHDWALPRASGLTVEISGTAPDASAQKAALADLRNQFGPESVLDATRVSPEVPAVGPEPLVRLQRSGGSVILFGAVAGEDDRDWLIGAAEKALPDKISQIMLQPLPESSPPGWKEALEFAIRAIALPQVSLVEADHGNVSVTALTESEQTGQLLIQRLDADKPDKLAVTYKLSSVPPPLVSPYALGVEIGPADSSFTACHAESTADRDRIIASAAGENRAVTGGCRLARGAPDRNWADAAETVINVVTSSGGGVISADGHEFVVAPADETSFAYLRWSGFPGLPDGYTILLAPPETDDTESEVRGFTVKVTKGPDGYIEIDGTFPDETNRRMTVFSSWATLDANYVQDNTSIEPDVDHPAAEAVMFASESLNFLHAGSVTFQNGHVLVSGVSDDPQAEGRIADLLSQGFDEKSFFLDITYDNNVNAPPPPMDPRLCIQMLKDTQKQGKIAFEPGSARIRSNALDTIEQMAEVLQGCQHVPIEISGHTDNQGRETMNQRLSELRARAVLNALLDARFNPKNITAIGYGESQPVGDNSTPEGREANRRIEFRLLDDRISAPQ